MNYEAMLAQVYQQWDGDGFLILLLLTRLMTESPLVSVLICTHNAGPFIADTVRSVWLQRYRNIEIIVLDDHSGDDTLKRLATLAQESPMPMQVLQSATNLGPYAGLNLLLDKANGAFVAILDHDDLWHCNKISQQVEFLKHHPEYPGCGAQIYVWWEGSGRANLYRAREIDRVAYHITLMYRNIGDWRYNPSLTYRTDVHFMTDVICGGGRRIYNLQTPLAVWRIRSDGANLSRKWNSMSSLLNYWSRTHAHLDVLKGLLQFMLPAGVTDSLLRSRLSILETRAGNPDLFGFPPPFGPEGIFHSGEV